MQNTGKEQLRHLIVLNVSNGSFSQLSFPDLGAGQFHRIDLSKAQKTTREELKSSLVASLTKEGLYAAEAKSMVKTWEDSWLDEQGLRVLYVLGREWTDKTLPLKITPQPQEIARVMVGRSELISPKVEIVLRDAVNDFAKGDKVEQERAVAKVRALNLGRFHEPAARLVIKKNPGAQFSKAAMQLTAKSSQEPASPPLALK